MSNLSVYLGTVLKHPYHGSPVHSQGIMSDSFTFPDRLCVNPKSPYYDEALLARGVGIRFNGTEKTNVEEYCVSEKWIRVAVGKTVDRHGDPIKAPVAV